MSERTWRLIVVSPEGIASSTHITYRDVPLPQEVALVPQDLRRLLVNALHNLALASEAPAGEVRRRAAESIRDVRQLLKGCASELWREQRRMDA